MLLLLAFFGLNKTDVEKKTVDERNVPLASLGIAELLDESRGEEFFSVVIIVVTARTRTTLLFGIVAASFAVHESVNLGLGEGGLLEAITVVVEKRRRLVDLRKLIELQGGREGIRKLDVLGERREDDVAKLHPAGGDDVAERLVVQEQEIREVVQQEDEDLEQAAVEEHRGLGGLTLLSELVSELDSVGEHGEVGLPSAGIGCEEAGNEDAVAEELDPGEGESGNLRGVQAVVKSACDDGEELDDSLRGSGFLVLSFLIGVAVGR